MKKEATYNTDTKKGSYDHYIYHGELVNGAKVKNDTPNAYGQSLAAKKGIDGAKRMLMSRYKKS